MFWEKIRDDLVFADLEAVSSDEIFETLGKRLIKLGYCEESYVDALKEREKVFPTGILVDTKGVSIPHTDPEHVKKSAIAIATLKNSVEFYHMGTNPAEGMIVPVKFVIMLAIAGNGHLEMLQKAVGLIQDIDVLEQMMTADNGKEIIQIIRAKEEAN